MGGLQLREAQVCRAACFSLQHEMPAVDLSLADLTFLAKDAFLCESASQDPRKRAL